MSTFAHHLGAEGGAQRRPAPGLVGKVTSLTPVEFLCPECGLVIVVVLTDRHSRPYEVRHQERTARTVTIEAYSVHAAIRQFWLSVKLHALRHGGDVESCGDAP